MSYQPVWDGRSYYGGKRGGAYGGKQKGFSPAKLLALLLTVAVFCFCALEGIVLREGKTEIHGDPQVMVIFGCQVKPWGPSILLQDRLDTALEYLKNHPDMTVVVAGGKGDDEPQPEAQCMYDYLTAHGVDGERIMMEDQSRNTWQNVNYTVELLGEKGYDTTADLLAVSSDFHLARIRMLYNRVYSNQYLSTLAAPVSHAPSRVKMFFREPLALVKSFVLDR